MADRRRVSAARGPGRPRGPARDLRSRALTTARQLFGERGYEATTFELIASRLGVSRPAVSYYFDGKRQLYGEVVAAMAASVDEVLNRALAEPTLVDQLRHLLEGLDREGVAAFLTSSATQSHEQNDRCPAQHDIVRLIHGFASTAVRDASQRGELATSGDSAAVADMLTAMIVGTLSCAGPFGEISATAVVDGLAAIVHTPPITRAMTRRRAADRRRRIG
ncbi:MAG TPA: helix-turn-helix domain-containing protein [Mycobacterium sp.]|nr:helix-turn-helix domain-containing protein [Mycobacterium sp.]